MESEIETLTGTVARQQEELSRKLKEAASMELKVQRMQQDQNDAQARLKMAYRENEDKSAVIKDLQKKCELLEMEVDQMRELGLGSDGNLALINERTQLKDTILQVTLENEELKKQVHSARIHYDSYKADLDVRMAEVTKDCNDARQRLVQKTEALHNAEDQIRDLTNDLLTLKEKQSSTRDGSNHSPDNDGEIRALQVYAGGLHEKYSLVCEKQQETIVELTEVKKAYDALKQAYEACEHQLEEERSSVRRLKEANDNAEMISTDVRSLMEQLANEKATVSRAVSQNSELKEQLIDLENKLIKVMNESADREQQLQSALFTIEQLRESSVQQPNVHVAEPSSDQCHVRYEEHNQNQEHEHSENIDNINGHSYNVNVENHQTRPIIHEDSSEDDSSSCDSEAERDHVSNEDSELGGQPATSQTALIPEHEVICLREKLQNVTDELEIMRTELRRITAENNEFHRIMEQNAEDENQNNIHVELGHAMNRISDLNAENEQLRLELNNTTNGNIADFDASSKTDSSDGEKRTAVTRPSSDTAQQTDGKPMIGSALWTREELEGRLVRALQQNAEIVDKNERLEHMLIALETENDTIGEYVTLYQHQRTKIRTRLEERDQQIAQLTQEKMRVQKKLNELQSTVFSLFAKRGLLQPYQTGQILHGSKAAAEAAKNRRVTKRSGKIRTFSQSISDEFSGEEEVIIDSEELYLPPLPDKEAVVDIEALEGQQATTSNGVQDQSNPSDNSVSDGDVRVTKILQLLTDLQTPEKPSQPFDADIHCKDCRGSLITI
uniref:GOLGA2L5 domain-containing protein n=1 Tax=Steinernema glaseri TaxID=37863 RepID=A0A1I7YIG8_9BILA